MWCTGMRMAQESLGASGPGGRFAAFRDRGSGRRGQAGRNSYGHEPAGVTHPPSTCPGALRARIRRCRSSRRTPRCVFWLEGWWSAVRSGWTYIATSVRSRSPTEAGRAPPDGSPRRPSSLRCSRRAWADGPVGVEATATLWRSAGSSSRMSRGGARARQAGPSIGHARIKTDEVDAEVLADLLAADLIPRVDRRRARADAAPLVSRLAGWSSAAPGSRTRSARCSSRPEGTPTRPAARSARRAARGSPHSRCHSTSA